MASFKNPHQQALVASAKRYAQHGAFVLPTMALTKAPLLRSATGLGGLYLATTNVAQIVDWWNRWPNAGVGVRTGKLSEDPNAFNFDVIDFDINAEFKDLRDHLSGYAVKLLGPLLDDPGPLVRSGGGGWHLLVQPGLMQGNHTKFGRIAPGQEFIDGDGEVHGPGEGFDIKAANGYVKAPPSMHQSGGQYQVVRNFNFPLPVPPAELCAATAPVERERPNPLRSEVLRRLQKAGGDQAYGLAALDRNLDLVMEQSGGTGSRHTVLRNAVMVTFQLVGGGELQHSATEQRFRSAGEAIGLPDREIDAIMKWAIPIGLGQPRDRDSRPQAVERGGRMSMGMTMGYPSSS